MRVHIPAALIASAAVAACGAPDRNEGAPSDNVSVAPAEPPLAAPPAPPSKAPGASIMRPSVVDETAPVEPAPPPPPEQVRTTISFADGGSDLSDAARRVIDELLATPRFAEFEQVVLRGHSDSEGSDQANLATSRRRAESVQAYLVERGVGEDRIEVIALGERRPVAPNANLDGSDYEEGRRRNRRVELLALDPRSPAPPPDEAAAPE